jgi:hypothetical protein
VFIHGGARHLIVKTSPGVFEVHSLAGMTEQSLLSSISLDATNDMLLEHLPLFAMTSPFRNFTLQVASPGDVIRHSVPPTSSTSTWQICAFTNKGAPCGSNQFFDLTAHTWVGSSSTMMGSPECLTYSARAVRGAFHTGDQKTRHVSPGTARSTDRLFHGMSFPRNKGLYWITGATGYSKTSLRNMATQMPSIVIVDYASETMYLLPYSVQEAVVGDATMSIAAVTRYEGDGVFVTYALSGQVNVEYVNTGDRRPVVISALQRAIGEVEVTQARLASAPSAGSGESRVSTPSASAPTVDAAEESKIGPLSSESTPSWNLGPLTLAVQESILYSSPDPCGGFTPFVTPTNSLSRFTFLRGMTWNPSSPPPPLGPGSVPVVLPSLFGPCKGGSEATALLLAHNDPALPPLDTFQSAFATTLPVVFVEQYGWSRQVAMTRQTVMNGIIILKVADGVDFANRAAREEAMNGLNRDAFLLGGPMSIALVEFPCGSRAFYRGVSWPCPSLALPPSLAFGDDVTSLLSNEAIVQLATTNRSEIDWPILMDANDTSIFLPGEGLLPYRVAIDRCLSSSTPLTTEEVDALQATLVTTLHQVAILLQPDALKVIREELLHALNDAVLAIEAPIKTEMHKVATDMVEAADEDAAKAARTKLQTLTTSKRQVRRRFQTLIDTLQAMVSQKASSSRKADLARMVRQSKIASNVAAATSMTPEALRNYVEGIEEFVMVTLPSPEALGPLLQATSFSTLCTSLCTGSLGTTLGAPRLAEPKANFIIADGTTVSVLAEIGDPDRGHTLACATAGTPSLALPLSTHARHLSMLPIPLFMRYVDMPHPSAYMWVEEANRPEVATFRILLRSVFSQGNASRSISIPAASKELTFFVIHFLLEVMESLVDRMSAPPTPGDTGAYESTSARILRGLAGLVFTTMGSGANPASSFWQMVMGQPRLRVPDAKEWWILRSLARVLPYTGWSMEVFHANLKEMVCRMIRRTLTGPAVEALTTAGVKAVTMVDGHRTRARIGAWNGVASLVLRVWPTIGEPDRRDVAARVLQMMPSVDEVGHHQSFEHLSTFFSKMASGSVEEEIYVRARSTAVGVLLKHGCVMKPLKEAIHAKRLRGEDDSAEVAAFTAMMAELDTMRSPMEKAAGPVPVRNLDAVLSSSSPLTGDSDLAREPWSVGGAVEPFWTDDEIQKRAARCIGSAPVSSGGDVYESKTAEVVPLVVQPRVITTLTTAGATEGSPVLLMARAAASDAPYPSILSMARKAFDQRSFSDMLISLGVAPSAFQPLICEMVTAQLMALHDHDKALASSLGVLSFFIS